MPLVITKTGTAQHVRSEEVLGETLGHSDFDGEPWAVGDRIIFEDGTEARIEPVPDDMFYTWSDPVPANLDEVKRAVGFEDAQNWEHLFGHFQPAPKSAGCASIIILMALAAASASAIV